MLAQYSVDQFVPHWCKPNPVILEIITIICYQKTAVRITDCWHLFELSLGPDEFLSTYHSFSWSFVSFCFWSFAKMINICHMHEGQIAEWRKSTLATRGTYVARVTPPRQRKIPNLTPRIRQGSESDPIKPNECSRWVYEIKEWQLMDLGDQFFKRVKCLFVSTRLFCEAFKRMKNEGIYKGNQSYHVLNVSQKGKNLR